MFKTLVIALLFWGVTTPAVAYGAALDPKIDSSGKAAFGIQYVYDVDPAWTLILTSTLTSAEISQLPATLYWTVVDRATASIYQPWSQMSRNDLAVGSYGVRDASVLARFLPRMKDALVAISADKVTSLYLIDLQSLCERYPKNISDATNPSNPKCVVETSQMPEVVNECSKHQARYQKLLVQGLLTCAIANTQLAKNGCAPLNCQ